jgi:hypothetical protein
LGDTYSQATLQQNRKICGARLPYCQFAQRCLALCARLRSKSDSPTAANDKSRSAIKALIALRHPPRVTGVTR